MTTGWGVGYLEGAIGRDEDVARLRQGSMTHYSSTGSSHVRAGSAMVEEQGAGWGCGLP